MRPTLHEAASSLLTRSLEAYALKAWGMKGVTTRGRKRIVIAVARKLEMIMHRIWRDG